MIKLLLLANLVFGQECFKVEKLEKVARPQASPVQSATPTPSPKPSPIADCVMMPPLNYSGFIGWLGWKSIPFYKGEVKRLCFNIEKDQPKLAIQVVDVTGAAQCWHNEIKVWNPSGELVKDTTKQNSLAGPNSYAKFSPTTLIEKGLWKFEIIEATNADSCNRNAQITVH